MGIIQLQRRLKVIGATSSLLVPLLVIAKPARSQTPSLPSQASWEQDISAAQWDVQAGRLPEAEQKFTEVLRIAKTFPLTIAAG